MQSPNSNLVKPVPPSPIYFVLSGFGGQAVTSLNMNIKYEATFEKKGAMVYISHLDVMTLLRRAIRRSGLPFFLTGGFTPRVKISIPKALKLGVESSDEKMSLWLTEERGLKEVRDSLNGELPEGIRVLEVGRV